MSESSACAFAPSRLSSARTSTRREFRNMRVVRHDAQHAAKADAGGEPVDQPGELFPVIGRAGVGNAYAKSGLHGIEPLRDETERRIMSKPKPGSCSSPSAVRRSANRRRISAASRIARLVAAESRSTLPSTRNSTTSTSRAPSPCCSSVRSRRLAEPLDGAEHVALERDRIGEALLGDVARQGPARRDRLVVAPQGLVETPDQLGRRTGRRARRAADRARRRRVSSRPGRAG